MNNKLKVRVFPGRDALALAVADRVCAVAETCRSEGQPMVIGLASGASPRGVYRALANRVSQGQLDLGRCVAFCLDEYYPIGPEDPLSYARQMSSITTELGIPGERFHIPSGHLPREQIEDHCMHYEEMIQRAGGIDFQILGVGRSGHIGFNEPGTPKESRTRLVRLDERTRQDAAASFGALDLVPREAVTVGIGTILDAGEIALIAFGVQKAEIVRRLVEEPPSPDVPASFLQAHDGVTIYVDEDAAHDLTRHSRP